MLETALFSPGEIIHHPFRPFVTPIHPSLILDFTLEKCSTKHVERRHGVDVLGCTFSFRNGILSFEPVESGLERVLCRGGNG
jgi:hypothetical protein